MDPLSRLPIECLQHILRILNNDDNFAAMARLLRTNKHIASVTLTFLYRDPFRLKADKVKTWERRRSRPKYYDKLIRMLLSRLPRASLPKSLSLLFTADSADSSSSLDYLAHIRHLNIPLRDRSGLKELLRQYYQVVLHQETLWSLAYPILEQLQSFSIPMHFFNRYHSVVNRFQSLELVRFMTSDVFEPVFDEDVDTDSDTDSESDSKNGKEYMMQRRDELVQEMKCFVQDHIRFFKGRLKFVRWREDGVWKRTDEEFIDRVQLDFYRLLPPLCNPTHLTSDNWLQFSIHPQTIDLAHVREFSSIDLPKTWEDIICNNQSILQRCRALERICLDTMYAGTFKWAVQEKNKTEQEPVRNIATKNDRVGQQALEQDETLSSAHRIRDLVPLKSVNIRHSDSLGADDINDVLFAFNHTLQELSIVEWCYSNLDRPKSCHIRHGLVHFPALTLLNLSLGSERLVLDTGLLSHCPNLITVHLRDMTLTYSCRDIAPCLPAHLDCLEVLQLVGWSALTFNPATFSSTTRLRHLNMEVFPWHTDRGYYPRKFIPPVEELNRSYSIQDGPSLITIAAIATDLEPEIIRPRWTWDWHLPFLISIDLASEFAYLFEFKMLHGCPALEILSLDIRSTIPGTHTRVISESDLFVTTSINTSTGNNNNNNNNNSNNGSLPPVQQQSTTERQRLCSSTVTTLNLRGGWVIDKEIMPQLLAGMFPNVKDLYVTDWNLPAMEGLVKLFRDMSIKYDDASLNVHIFLRPTSEEMARLGIVAYQENANPADYLSLRLLHVSNTDEYRLLKSPPSFP
ncbi:hypothetical protein BG015_008657 [Linnemannia schmuckeri]|uniref:F-box domain-containing protein n=1 Tax=Linnemannia schmuckeri TaxID=64567 RepID=A0A9P5VAI5_9FUNG|nr:hypothetical protein BG015_008657 [Linnemannia schmuckeri]